ncbi:MAG: hypothetical protein ACI97N_002601 [Cognaticolwellia sp.]|jgi:hypothetical protein
MTKKLFFICLSIFTFGSCLTPDNVKLDDVEKNARIRTLAATEIKKLEPLFEISCDANFDKLVDRAVDSLVNVYLDSTRYDY